MSLATALDRDLIRCYEEHGYTVVAGLFSRSETDRLRAHFEAMRQSQLAAGTLHVGDDITDIEDPLAVYPRILQPHRHDAVSRDWLLDARLRTWLNALTGRDPVRGADHVLTSSLRGRAGRLLHQDQYHLRVQPGTCTCRLDGRGPLRPRDRLPAGGAPAPATFPVLCTKPADHHVSFSTVTVPLAAAPGARGRDHGAG